MITQRNPTHPLEILREDLIVLLGLTVTETKRLGGTRKTLSALINCKVALSPEMALKLRPQALLLKVGLTCRPNSIYGIPPNILIK